MILLSKCTVFILLHCNFFSFFRFTAHRGLGFLIHYLYSITVWSQTTLWWGPGPRFESGTGDLEAGTLTTRPPHLHIVTSTVFYLLYVGVKPLCYSRKLLPSLWDDVAGRLLPLLRGAPLGQGPDAQLHHRFQPFQVGQRWSRNMERQCFKLINPQLCT